MTLVFLRKLLSFIFPLFLSSPLISAAISNDPPTEEPSVSALREGIYYGYVAVNGQQTKIPVSVEIIKTNELLKEFGYRYHRAILKLSLGGFDSFEYTVQDYNVYTQTHFALERSHKGNDHNILSLTQTEVSSDGLKITGQIESAYMSILGSEVKLLYHGEQDFESLKSQLETLFPDRTLVPPITGEYEGKCHDKVKRLQLYAARGAKRNGLLLEGFSIQGRYGIRSEASTDRVLETPFITNSAFRSHLREVSYNYFTNVVQLPAFGSNCKFVGDRLVCDESQNSIKGKCSLLRKNSTLDQGGKASLLPVDSIHPYNSYAMSNGSKRNPSSDFQGRISLEKFATQNFLAGFIEHNHKALRERLLFTADVNSYINPETGLPGKKLTLRGKLFLGNDHHDIAPFLDIRFATIHFNPEESGKLTLIGEDFIAVFSNFNSENVTGFLYARHFGFMGSFSLNRLAQLSDFEELSCQSPPLHGAFSAHQFNQYGDFVDISMNLFLMPASSRFPESLDSFFLHKLNGNYSAAVFHKRFYHPNGSTISERTAKMISSRSLFDPFTRVFYSEFTDQSSLFGIHTDQGFLGFLSEPESERWSIEEMLRYRYNRTGSSDGF